jgi:hypothetical protein
MTAIAVRRHPMAAEFVDARDDRRHCEHRGIRTILRACRPHMSCRLPRCLGGRKKVTKVRTEAC